MPKITIDLDVNTHQILKELAKKEKRSLTNYIIITLDNHANSEEKNVNTINLQSNQSNNTTTIKKLVCEEEGGKKLEWN